MGDLQLDHALRMGKQEAASGCTLRSPRSHLRKDLGQKDSERA